MTNPANLNKPVLKEKAIRQIEKKFADSKKIKVGISKGQNRPGVTATNVFDLIPLQEAIPL